MDFLIAPLSQHTNIGVLHEKVPFPAPLEEKALGVIFALPQRTHPSWSSGGATWKA